MGTNEGVAEGRSREVSWLFSWLRSRPDTLGRPRPRSSWLALVVESVSTLKSGTLTAAVLKSFSELASEPF